MCTGLLVISVELPGIEPTEQYLRQRLSLSPPLSGATASPSSSSSSSYRGYLGPIVSGCLFLLEATIDLLQRFAGRGGLVGCTTVRKGHENSYLCSESVDSPLHKGASPVYRADSGTYLIRRSIAQIMETHLRRANRLHACPTGKMQVLPPRFPTPILRVGS